MGHGKHDTLPRPSKRLRRLCAPPRPLRERAQSLTLASAEHGCTDSAGIVRVPMFSAAAHRDEASSEELTRRRQGHQTPKRSSDTCHQPRVLLTSPGPSACSGYPARHRLSRGSGRPRTHTHTPAHSENAMLFLRAMLVGICSVRVLGCGIAVLPRPCHTGLCTLATVRPPSKITAAMASAHWPL
jgi:hypothetical protein